MAADDASIAATEVDVSEGLPMAMITPADEAPRTLALSSPLSSLVLDLSPAGSFALSVSERLQLREQIRKAAQDIYSEGVGSPAHGEVSRIQGGGIALSP